MCDKSFSRIDNLKTHVTEAHDNKGERTHTCELCGKSYLRAYELKQHSQSIHEGIPKPKDILCDICGRRFTKQSKLTWHLKYDHLKIKRFKCDRCNKAFNQPKFFNQHKLKCKPAN